MLKIKKVVETEVEIPAPDIVVFTWVNPQFDYKEAFKEQHVRIGDLPYRVSKWDMWSESYGGFPLYGDLPCDLFVKVEFKKVLTVAKWSK